MYPEDAWMDPDDLITEGDVQDAIRELLECDEEEVFPELERVNTYEEAGVLTTDAGLVLRTADGSEFQLTIVRAGKFLI